MGILAKEFYLPFIKKEKLVKDTYSFYFDRVRRGLSFLPGQYMRMILDIKNPDERGNSRFFTIASSPLEKDYIMITTKITQSPVPDGTGESSFKKRLIELKAQEKVQFFGPMGEFVLNEEKKEDRVFLAGGIGITPFHSMLTYAYQKILSIPIALIVSFSTAQDIFWHKELQEIATNNPSIKVIYTVSRPEKSNTKWNGETGRISDVLIKSHVPDFLRPLYYIVGPPAMVAGIEDVVKKIGVSSEKIFIENFTGY